MEFDYLRIQMFLKFAKENIIFDSRKLKTIEIGVILYIFFLSVEQTESNRFYKCDLRYLGLGIVQYNASVYFCCWFFMYIFPYWMS